MRDRIRACRHVHRNMSRGQYLLVHEKRAATKKKAHPHESQSYPLPVRAPKVADLLLTRSAPVDRQYRNQSNPGLQGIEFYQRTRHS